MWSAMRSGSRSFSPTAVGHVLDEARGQSDRDCTRGGGPVICPDCNGNRLIGGMLCTRCHGNAQIPRDQLRPGEHAPFEERP